MSRKKHVCWENVCVENTVGIKKQDVEEKHGPSVWSKLAGNDVSVRACNIPEHA